MSKPATDSKLNQLHEALATQMLAIINGTRKDADGNTIHATAAELSAAVTFLKNNNITCVPSDDNALGRLEKKLQEKQHGRPPVRRPADLDSDFQFGPPRGMQ